MERNSQNINTLRSIIFITSFLFAGWGNPLYSQDSTEFDTWDNALFLGNKVAFGTGKWRFSGELQIRLHDNLKSLDAWYVETIGSRLLTKHWQIQIPIRYSFKPSLNEFRPGLGVFYKMYPKEKMQLAHQIMYQADINSLETKHGLRYVLFYTWKATEKLIPTATAGIFQRWQNNFTGIQFIRIGPGLGYQVDVKHFINFSYFIGFENRGAQWTYQGIFFFQLVININKDYQYLPARVIQF